jgi:hypothetical protein
MKKREVFLMKNCDHTIHDPHHAGCLPAREEVPREAKKITSTPPVERPEIDKNVNQPDHYMTGGIEAIDVIAGKLNDDEFVAYCKGNCLKYLMRANYKGKHDEDLLKAEYYLKKAADVIRKRRS